MAAIDAHNPPPSPPESEVEVDGQGAIAEPNLEQEGHSSSDDSSSDDSEEECPVEEADFPDIMLFLLDPEVFAVFSAKQIYGVDINLLYGAPMSDEDQMEPRLDVNVMINDEIVPLGEVVYLFGHIEAGVSPIEALDYFEAGPRLTFEHFMDRYARNASHAYLELCSRFQSFVRTSDGCWPMLPPSQRRHDSLVTAFAYEGYGSDDTWTVTDTNTTRSSDVDDPARRMWPFPVEAVRIREQYSRIRMRGLYGQGECRVPGCNGVPTTPVWRYGGVGRGARRRLQLDEPGPAGDRRPGNPDN